jgi:hypothetical protein
MDPVVEDGMSAVMHSASSEFQRAPGKVSDEPGKEVDAIVSGQPATTPLDHAGSFNASSKRNYSVTLHFQSLSANGIVDILLYSRGNPVWCVKDQADGIIRMRLEAPANATPALQRFAFNRKRLHFEVADGCPDLRLSLYMNSDATLLQGRVDLPVGSILTFESDVDKTNVVGRGSFALMLGRECEPYSS